MLRKLTRDVESDARTLNFRSDITFAPLRKTPKDVRKGCYVTQNVKKERNPNPRVNGKFLKLDKPHFRHYPFNSGLGFLWLHRRPRVDSIDTNYIQDILYDWLIEYAERN